MACSAPALPSEGDASKALTVKDSVLNPKTGNEKIRTPSTISVSVPIGDKFQNYFGNDGVMNGKHLSWLDAGIVSVGGISSRYEEKIVFSNSQVFGPQTAATMAVYDNLGIATSDSEEFGGFLFIPATPNSMSYLMTFENTGIFDTVSEENPLVLNFLGKELKIVNTQFDTIQVKSGFENLYSAGDSAVIDGKTLTLIRTNDGGAVIDVDGILGVVDEGEMKYVNGLYAELIAAYDQEGVVNDSALIIAGIIPPFTDYQSNDAYLGEDVDDPAWVWTIELANGIIGVEFDLDIDRPNENDNPEYQHPLYEGEAYVFPERFASLKFDGIESISNSQYTVEISSEDLMGPSGMNVMYSDAMVIQLNANNGGDYGFLTSAGYTESVYLYAEDGQFSLFQKEANGSDVVFVGNYSSGNELFILTGSNLESKAYLNSWNGYDGILSLDLGNGIESLDLEIRSLQNGGFGYLGDGYDDMNQSNDLVWNYANSTYPLDLSFREANLRLVSGTVVQNPDMTLSQDMLVFYLASEMPQKAKLLLFQEAYVPPKPEEKPNIYMEP